MSNFAVPSPDSSQIYEGGGVSQIAANELIGNDVAIRQLINSHNISAAENKDKSAVISSLKSEIEYLKTSPFVAITSAIVNIVGAVLIGLAENLLTTDKPATIKDQLLLVAGIILVGVSSLSTILYPYARKFFNEPKA